MCVLRVQLPREAEYLRPKDTVRYSSHSLIKWRRVWTRLETRYALASLFGVKPSYSMSKVQSRRTRWFCQALCWYSSAEALHITTPTWRLLWHGLGCLFRIWQGANCVLRDKNECTKVFQYPRGFFTTIFERSSWLAVLFRTRRSAYSYGEQHKKGFIHHGYRWFVQAITEPLIRS